jgi:hypothetical protein
MYKQVIEDSLVGLRAAKGAGMKCIITYTESTKDEDFYAEGADAVVADLANVDLDAIFNPMYEGKRDPFAAFKEAPRTGKPPQVIIISCVNNTFLFR